MKKSPSLRSFIILAILFLIIYALIDGIRYGNILGIVLAIGSMGAFGISILLINRLRRLKELEEERAGIATRYWFGERISHADIAVACMLRFTGEAHPDLFEAARYPALAAHAAHCEALPAFQEIVQPLKPPSGD